MLLCQEPLDLIEEVSLRVLLAPTVAMGAPVMAPVMEEIDIAAMVPVMVPATMVPAMAPATIKKKNATPPTKSIAPTSRNKNVNIHTKP